jgi:Patatin-like phospholipase
MANSSPPVVPVENNDPLPSDYVKNFDDVLVAEHKAIAERRDFVKAGKGIALRQRAISHEKAARVQKQSLVEDVESYSVSGVKDTVGLALSGGGIRSAAFCTGVLQALAKHGALKKIDYLSTVSGGGYAGISTVLSLNANGGDYPFFKTDEIKDTSDLGVLRDNANYLLMGQAVGMLKNVAVVAKGLVANFLFVASILLLFAALTLWAKPTIDDLCRPGLHILSAVQKTKCEPYSTYLVSLIVIGFYVGLIAIWAIWASIGKKLETLQGNFIGLVGAGLVVVGVVALCDLQPHLVRNMIPAKYFENEALATVCPMTPAEMARLNAAGSTQSDVCSKAEVAAKTVVPSLAVEPVADKKDEGDKGGLKHLVTWLQTIVAPLIALIALASKQLGDLFKTNEQEKGPKVVLKKLSGRLIVWAAALTLPLVMWACYLGLVYWGIADAPSGKPLTYPFAPYWLSGILHACGMAGDKLTAFAQLYLLAGLVAVGIWIFTLIDPNANSLFGLYRARLKDAFLQPWASKMPDMKISKLDPRYAPLLIVNAALNVQSSTKVNSRGRNADFFSFTPCYVGSKATGFARTEKFEERETQLDLASAMAISGAAVSSNMGSISMRPLRATLALLNARLGAWLLNPKDFTSEVADKPKSSSFFFLAEFFGLLTEDKRDIYLTDGGHIENLGIYELLRRRCKIIIVVDAEADRDMNFSALVTLQRYARIDLGARIKLPRSGIATRSKDAQKPDGKSANGPHCAIGKIEYNKSEQGILVYVKSSVTGDENDYIKDYNRRFRDFPHETTGDQFFSEEQFEVYRALGFHAVDEMLSGTDVVQTTAKDLETLASPTPQGHGVAEFVQWLDTDVLKKAMALAPGA